MQKEKVEKWLKRVRIITGILFILVVAVMILAFADFYDKVEAKQETSRETYLTNIANEEVSRLNLKLDGYFDEMDLIAAFVTAYDDITDDAVVDILTLYKENHDPVEVDVVLQNGSGLMETSVIDDITEYDFFYDAFDGKGGIYGGMTTTAGENSVLFVYPVEIDGEVLACFLAAFPESEFEDFAEGSIFASQTSNFIVQSDGTLISKTSGIGNNTNLFDVLNASEATAGISKSLETQMAKRSSGILTYGSGDSLRYILYEPLSQGDLYMVVMLSASVIESSSSYIADCGTRLGIIIVLANVVFDVWLMFIFLMHGRNRWIIKFRKRKKMKDPIKESK
ncbi:MAG: cache domain-containing protein [Lachnospiraceae bacterium]|nr:cache domain-containing protein [Lachnospiraceae bacterium]